MIHAKNNQVRKIKRPLLREQNGTSTIRWQCIRKKCRSSDIQQIVTKDNHIIYRCGTCKRVNGRVLEVDRKTRLVLTDDGKIKHISVAALIKRHNKLLMTNRRAHPFGLAMPVGHWEFGETLEQALAREVFEETGLIVTSHDYVGRITLPVSECRAGSDIEEWEVYEVVCADSQQATVNYENHELLWVDMDHLSTTIMTDPARYALCKIAGYITDPAFVEAQEARRNHEEDEDDDDKDKN